MRVEKFNAKNSRKISEEILSNYPSISYSHLQKLFRNRDIKLNGKRISKDAVIQKNDEIVFYIKEIPNDKLDIIYEDENVICVFKPRKIETVSEKVNNDLQTKVANYLSSECYAVHRLDMNTEGLVLFAKNENAKKSLDLAFKNRTIEKYYLARVYGRLAKLEDKMIAYLKKFADKSYVDIIDKSLDGYDKIQTDYKVICEKDDNSIIEVHLVTGKTHQIRAHFAHIGHFVIGDEKYGDSKINKQFGCKYQNLCAYKIIFKFKRDDLLSYLDGKEIVIDKNKIDFCQNL